MVYSPWWSLAAEDERLKENERLGQENLSVQDQLTELTRSRPNHDQRWAEMDRESGNCAPLTTAVREPRSEGGTRVPWGESPRVRESQPGDLASETDAREGG